MAKAEERPVLVPRWVALLLTAIAIGLVVWTLYLSYALPARHVTQDWRIAWAGFDIGLALAIGRTAGTRGSASSRPRTSSRSRAIPFSARPSCSQPRCSWARSGSRPSPE